MGFDLNKWRLGDTIRFTAPLRRKRKEILAIGSEAKISTKDSYDNYGDGLTLRLPNRDMIYLRESDCFELSSVSRKIEYRLIFANQKRNRYYHTLRGAIDGYRRSKGNKPKFLVVDEDGDINGDERWLQCLENPALLEIMKGTTVFPSYFQLTNSDRKKEAIDLGLEVKTITENNVAIYSRDPEYSCLCVIAFGPSMT